MINKSCLLIFHHFLITTKPFSIKSRSNECHKLLEGFRKSELKNLAIQTQNRLQCEDFNQRWYGFITDNKFAKIHKKDEQSIKKAPKSIQFIFFDNKGLEVISLHSILYGN